MSILHVWNVFEQKKWSFLVSFGAFLALFNFEVHFYRLSNDVRNLSVAEETKKYSLFRGSTLASYLLINYYIIGTSNTWATTCLYVFSLGASCLARTKKV